MDKHKLLVILGPTATGKTDLALSLAKKFSGELISADSRQVFKDLDIGTGKDKNLVGNIYGYDLVEAKDRFSLGQYLKLANKKITEIQKQGKLPIVVGGTGLYIKGLIDGIPTALIARNEDLRKTLSEKTPGKLFDILAQFDPTKAASLNQSDRSNPRRLVRAIEIAQARQTGLSVKKLKKRMNVCQGGLTTNLSFFEKRIKERIQARIVAGIEAEICNLFTMGVTWNDQAMTSLGYKEWQGFFAGKKNLEEVLSDWQKGEMQYVKRQLVWFKKDKRINWFDISDPLYRKNVENLVKKWYPRGTNAKEN